MQIKERLNIYICEHGCHNITVDVDKGTTPFMIGCLREGDVDRPLDLSKSKNGVCIGTAQSCMYPEKLGENVKYPVPTLEWYRPQLAEFNGLPDSEKEHVRLGGLLVRKRTAARPLMRADKWSYDDEDFKEAIKKFN